MLSVQTRRVYVRQQRPGPNEGWREIRKVITFSKGRNLIMDDLQRLGFEPYSEVCLLVDDLNPARYPVPEHNILTEDGGNEIRVLDLDRSEPLIRGAALQLDDRIRLEGDVYRVNNRTPGGLPEGVIHTKVENYQGIETFIILKEQDEYPLVFRREFK